MVTRGEYITLEGRYGVILDHSKDKVELLLIVNNTVYSAYKKEKTNQYSYANKEAKKLYDMINQIMGKCKSKNKSAVPFDKGVAARHMFKRKTEECIVDKFNDCLVGLDVKGDTYAMFLVFVDDNNLIPEGIQYIKLNESMAEEFKGIGVVDEQEVVVRSIEEVLLDKEVGYLDWIKEKKYYIINDEEQAEAIFDAIENFNGPVAYDVETTGLKINMFGKIGSKEKAFIEEYNANAEPKDKVRVDKLVGVILCVEPNVSYYFPCANRKFKNLYENPYEGTAKIVAERIQSNYTIGEHRDRTDEMAKFIRNTPINEWGSDVIMMERIRRILEKKSIVAHNGSFEWKASWLYNIDINLTDDSMILHQLMYKFRSTTSNRGEPSALKYLTKLEFGANTLELEDFFPDYKADKKGEVRSRDGKAKSFGIDFSYMTYEGTYFYAPADGDFTLQLFFKYKRDLLVNHTDLEYLYNVEVLTACLIGYTEFYGHKIDEEQIHIIRDNNKRNLIMLEHKIRVSASLSTPEEDAIFEELKGVSKAIKQIDDKLEERISLEEKAEFIKKRDELVEISKKIEESCVETIANSPNQINLGSPAQVGQLFYDRLKIPYNGDKISVGKKILKPYTQLRNEDGSPKYPTINLYTEWKKISTLLTKFFDNLQYFMYPGGYIFSGFGQIAAATGRMNCSKPNSQQYPGDVTKVVVPRENCIILDADYSQIEYRALVALAKEPGLMEKFKNADNDYHTMMASLMYNVPYALVDSKMRGDAKSFNFGIPYGMGFRSLAMLLRGEATKTNVEEAKEKYELYFKDQPNVRRFFDVVKEQAQVNKYTKTYWGRTRYYSFVDKEGKFNSGMRAAALRQAGNAVIQGSAADIFKIGIARVFSYIRANNLFGKLLIINLIHDEILCETNTVELNGQRILRDVAECMQIKVDGFPPLFIGAGFGKNWSYAKGKKAEIHPDLAEMLSREADNTPILANGNGVTPDDFFDYIQGRVDQFIVDKIRDYLLNKENHGEALHPAIGNLVNLLYEKAAKERGFSGTELATEELRMFIEAHGLEERGINVGLFAPGQQTDDVEENDGYDDEDDELDDFDEVGGIGGGSFALIDEDADLYNVDIREIIKLYGLIVSKTRKLCGIDATMIPSYMKDDLAEFVSENTCEHDEEGAMQIVFLRENNILFKTGVWIKGVDGDTIAVRLGLNNIESA